MFRILFICCISQVFDVYWNLTQSKSVKIHFQIDMGLFSRLCENNRDEQGGSFADYHSDSYLSTAYFLKYQPSVFMGTLLWMKHPWIGAYNFHT